MTLQDKVEQIFSDRDMELHPNAQLASQDIVDLIYGVVKETGGDLGKFGSLVFDVPLKQPTNNNQSGGK